MVGQKFFVYGGGRWREINLSTGRVAGWGSVQYLSVRRGRLELARRNAVLRGLKALAAGKSTSAHDGPQLSQIRNIVTKSLEEPKPVNNVCQHHQHCCQRNIHCNTDANFNDILKPVTSTIAIQCTISKNAKVTETNLIEKPNQTTKKSNNTNNVKKIDTRNGKTAKRKRVSSASSDVFSSTDSQTSDTNRNLSTSLHQRVKLSQNKEPCKELFISEEDILLMRTFVENDDNNVFGVDLERFDSDDLYKRLIFYKLNPLVNVERSQKISELIRKKDGLSESFKDFIKNLGLQSVEEASQVSSKKYKMRARRKRPKIDSNGEDFDKENINKQIVLKTSRANGVLAEKVSQMVVTRNAKSMRIKSATGLVKGSKSRPASKKRNDLTDDIMNQNDLKKNKEVTIKAKNDRTNESVKINDDKNNETVKNNESSKQNNLMKRNKQNNESKLSKKKEIDMKNEADDKNNTVNKKSDKLKVSDKVISNELNNKETLSDSDAKLVTSDSEEDQNDKREKGKMPRLAVVPARRSYVSGGPHRQPYSTAEDAMLVQWVRGSGRARHVNGNKLWRELQPIFFKKMGRFRSWHSLRNRYLRYLLPTLGSMSLPSDEAARLRADAAAGEIKKIVPNSIYKEKRVISAWSRRPRSPPRKTPSPPSPPSSVSPSSSIGQPSSHSSSSNSSTRSHDSDYSMESVKSVGKWNFKKIGTKQEKIKRALRSSAAGSSPKRNKQKHINPRTPTYSELTKRFALKHSTPDSDSTGYNNTDKNVRPTRFSLSLRRKGATDRQVVEISDDERTTVRNNSKNNKNSNLNNSKKSARNISTDRQDADYSDDSRKAKQSRSVDRQNSKNNLNNSRKRTRLNSSDSDDQIKTKQSNSKNNSINKSRKSIRKNSTDRQDTDTNDNQTKTKQSYSKNNSLNKNRRSTRKKSTDRQDSDTNDELIKIKQSNSKNNNLNKSRRSTRKNSTDRQETDNDEQSKTSTNRQYSKNNKNNLNKSRKRARESSTEEQNTDSSDEKQFKQNNKTINSKSPNKSSNNRQESSDDESNQKSYRLRKSDRHNNKNNSINNNKQNNLNKNKRKSNKTSNESSDFEENSKQVKKLRSDKSKADTGRPKTRRLYNPKEF